MMYIYFFVIYAFSVKYCVRILEETQNGQETVDIFRHIRVHDEVDLAFLYFIVIIDIS